MSTRFTGREISGAIILLILLAVAVTVICIKDASKTAPEPLPLRSPADTAVTVVVTDSLPDSTVKPEAQKKQKKQKKQKSAPSSPTGQRNHLDESC